METTTTTRTDEHGRVRTALVVDVGGETGSVDLVTADGTFLARVNVFTNEAADWLAVDVIDVGDRFKSRWALAFNDGVREHLDSVKLVGADFRGLKGSLDAAQDQADRMVG